MAGQQTSLASHINPPRAESRADRPQMQTPPWMAVVSSAMAQASLSLRQLGPPLSRTLVTEEAKLPESRKQCSPEAWLLQFVIKYDLR